MPTANRPALATLALDDNILQAALYDSNGKLLARHVRRACPPGRPRRRLPAPQADDAPRSERSGLPWAPALRVYRVLRSGDEATGVVMLEAAQTRIWLDVLKNLGAAIVAPRCRW
jgi:hypothetical protein